MINISKQAEERHLAQTLSVVRENISKYSESVTQMRTEIDNMLEHFHDDNPELINQLENTITLHEHMSRALDRNLRAQSKPYFGRIIFHDEKLNKDESLYIGKGGISRDATHWEVVDWRAPVANAYYENGLGKCSYPSPEGNQIPIDLLLKRTYEIDDGKLLNYFDSEVIANDELLTKYLAKNKQAVLGEIVATIQKEQNDIIRRSPYHNCLVQGVAGSGKTTVAMHRISYILYNYAERFKPDDFYIVGSNRILLNYITSVLPGLDVHGVRQMTMEQLFTRLLYEDWDDKKYRIKSTGTSRSGETIKGSLSWFRDLKSFCDQLEWNTIPRESIVLNPRQFVEGVRDGKTGVFDDTKAPADRLVEPVSKIGADREPSARTGSRPVPREERVVLMKGAAVERYIRQNPTVSLQSKINMLNSRLYNKIKEEFLKSIKYTAAEQKAIVKAYRGRYGSGTWKHSIYNMYHDFLKEQQSKGHAVIIPDKEFDVYDLAALAYLYKRIKETEVISEAHHVVIDEAQDFGMMAYSVLHFCIKDCTYTIMGDVSQNIHFGYGLNDWEELKKLFLATPRAGFEVLKKSYRNTIEISDFASRILHHGQFSSYPVEPIIRHGEPVQVEELPDHTAILQKAAALCKVWQTKGLDTIAVICRDQDSAAKMAKELGQFVEIMENDLEKAEFGKGILVLPVEYTKGLEFDAVLLPEPTRTEYPVDDGHAKLLYVAATRALHELCVLHTGNLTGLIADPLPKQHSRPENLITEPHNGNASRVTEPRNEHANRIKELHNKHVNPTTGQTIQPAKQAIAHPTQQVSPVDEPRRNRIIQITEQHNKPTTQIASRLSFGDMPPTEKLRPQGHARIDLAVRWVSKQPDGLYLQSRYGILRLSPIGSAIIRVTFSTGNCILPGAHPDISVTNPGQAWMYKDSSKTVELLTDELCLQVDKITGSIRYLTRDKRLLLAERTRESRQAASFPNGLTAYRLFLDWQKKETLYGFNPADNTTLKLRGTARCLSGEKLPLLLSDQGYGIVIASGGSSICCDIPAYGSYLYTECLPIQNPGQMDYYFLAGKNAGTLLAAYDYLCK